MSFVPTLITLQCLLFHTITQNETPSQPIETGQFPILDVQVIKGLENGKLITYLAQMVSRPRGSSKQDPTCINRLIEFILSLRYTWYIKNIFLFFLFFKSDKKNCKYKPHRLNHGILFHGVWAYHITIAPELVDGCHFTVFKISCNSGPDHHFKPPHCPPHCPSPSQSLGCVFFFTKDRETEGECWAARHSYK